MASLFSLIIHSGGSQLPHGKDTEATLWRGPRGRKLSPPAKSHQEPEASCHWPGEGAILERSASPNRPFYDCSLGLDCNLIRNHQPKLPKLSCFQILDPLNLWDDKWWCLSPGSVHLNYIVFCLEQ